MNRPILLKFAEVMGKHFYMGNHQIQVWIEYTGKNEKIRARHQGAVLLSMRMAASFLYNRDKLLGVGPELFAERWLVGNLHPGDPKFENLVVMYFNQILYGVAHGNDNKST